MTAPMVLNRLMNQIAFQAYTEQVLVLTLNHGDIVSRPRTRSGSDEIYPSNSASLETRSAPDVLLEYTRNGHSREHDHMRHESEMETRLS